MARFNWLQSPLLAFKQATVHKQHYMQTTKVNPSGAGRPIPWINLRGFWLEQAGFAIGTPYTIEVYDGKLIFIVDE